MHSKSKYMHNLYPISCPISYPISSSPPSTTVHLPSIVNDARVVPMTPPCRITISFVSVLASYSVFLIVLYAHTLLLIRRAEAQTRLLLRRLSKFRDKGREESNTESEEPHLPFLEYKSDRVRHGRRKVFSFLKTKIKGKEEIRCLRVSMPSTNYKLHPTRLCADSRLPGTV